MLTINLETHTLKNSKKILIQNGIPQNDYKIDSAPITFEKLEELYQIYKHSIPDKAKHKYQYFKVLDYEKLTTEDLVMGENRSKAKEALETALLTGILNGSLKWPDESKWFWQSETDKDFILLKKWFQFQ